MQEESCFAMALSPKKTAQLQQAAGVSIQSRRHSSFAHFISVYQIILLSQTGWRRRIGCLIYVIFRKRAP